MDDEAGTAETSDSPGREARVKLILLGVAVLLAVAYGVGLGFMESPLATLGSLAYLAVSTRFGMAAVAAVIVVAVALAVMLLRRGASAGAAVQPLADRLSSLANRSTLIERVGRQIEQHAAQGRQMALHVIDLDRFSALNSFGEEQGNALLALVAGKLVSLTGDADCVARIGDDEFAVIQPETGGARHAEIFARRVQESVRQACAEAGGSVRLDASIGVAVAPEHGDVPAKLLRSATLAMNLVKETGGGGFRIYTRHLDLEMDGRQHLEKAVAEGLQQGWFELQPT